jgi:hypothetical protein
VCYVTALVGESRFIRRGEQGLNRRMAQLISGKRTIVGGDGFEWLVREFESVGAGALSKSLVFERPEVVRRVRDYPGDWATLSDDQLYRLSLRT